MKTAEARVRCDDTIGAQAQRLTTDPSLETSFSGGNMPFAGYKNFRDCVEKNRDKESPDAYCGKIKHQVEDKPRKRKGRKKHG